MKFCYLGPQAISRAVFSTSITDMCTRSPNLGIPALEDGFSVNLLIYDDIYIYSGGAASLPMGI